MHTVLRIRFGAPLRVVRRNNKASHEPGLRHPPLDLSQRTLHTPVATNMGARAWDMRRAGLRDGLRLTSKPTTAGLAPQRHLASIERPQAAQFGVADQLGHADPSTTLKHYAHAMPEDDTDLSFLDLDVTKRHRLSRSARSKPLSMRNQWYAGRDSNPRPSGSKLDETLNDSAYLS